jgi:hypothetical protein
MVPRFSCEKIAGAVLLPKLGRLLRLAAGREEVDEDEMGLTDIVVELEDELCTETVELDMPPMPGAA